MSAGVPTRNGYANEGKMNMRTPRQLVNDLLAAAPDARLSDEEMAELNRVIDGVTRPSNAAVHKAVRNYLINELKITEESVGKVIQELAAERMTAWLNSQISLSGNVWRASRWLASVVSETVKAAIKDQIAARLRAVKITVVAE